MSALIRQAVSPLRSLRVVAMHLILNAVLIAAASYWLLIPDAHVWQLVFSVASALTIVCAFLWLHSGTLIYAAKQDFKDSFSIRQARWLSLFLGLAVLLWLMHRVAGTAASQWQIGGYLYSKAPAGLRPAHGSTAYVHAVRTFLSIVTWYVLPGLILPVTSARVLGSPLKVAFRAIFSWRYWLALAITTFLGVWTVKALLGWMPGSTLHQQTMGLAARMGLAYVVATAAWLLTAGLLAHFVSLPREQK
jgi:hypothetical protein